MGTRWHRAVALPVSALLMVCSSLPAAAQDDVAGQAYGDAGSAVAMMRLLAGSVPTSSVLPELSGLVAGSTSFEAGFGLGNAQANSTARLPYERSIAQATPYGSALTTGVPPAPGGLVQTAVPDNAEGLSGDLAPMGEIPVAELVSAGKMRGDVHARWSDQTGACVGTVASSRVEIDRFAAGFAVPTLPDIAIHDLPLSGSSKPPKGYRLPGGIGTLGGLLAGAQGGDDQKGSLVSLPNGMSTESTVRVIESPGKRKAVEATSTARVKSFTLLAGTKLAMTATVTKQPKLTVRATGDLETSTASATVAEVVVKRGSTTLFRLDAKHPEQDIPIGVPTAGFAKLAGAGELKRQPIVAGVAEDKKGRTVRLNQEARKEVIDLFVLRLTVGGLNTESTSLKEPFAGEQRDASARLLDIQVLPTKALAKALERKGDGRDDLPYEVPSTLAQYSIGEQVARAAAPPGGAVCGKPDPTVAGEQAGASSGIPTTTTAAVGVPLLWTGALLLLVGVLVVTVVPRWRPSGVRPSPQPRDGQESATD